MSCTSPRLTRSHVSKVNRRLLLIWPLVILQACAITHTRVEPVKILPLGNSITEGSPTAASYRRELWHMLDSAGAQIDFIGSMRDTGDFDGDHEGHSGWTLEAMLSEPSWNQQGNVRTWMSSYTPDIVLLEMGTNDTFKCVPRDTMSAQLGEIVQTIRSKNPKVRIFTGRILPLGSRWSEQALCHGVKYADLIVDGNAMLSRFASTASTKASPIRLVEFTGFDPAIHTYDAIHPNEAGARLMANAWRAALLPHLSRSRKKP